MEAAAIKAVFVIQAPDQARPHWQRVTAMLTKQFPTALPVLEAGCHDVLAFLHLPLEHWRKVWSTNQLERLNDEIKRRTNVVGIFPNDLATVRLVAANCRSGRRNGRWSAGAAFPKQRWPRSWSRKRLLSSPILNVPRR